MTRLKKLFLPCVLALLCSAPAFSVDFGLLLNQQPRLDFHGEEDEKVFSYTATAVPWFQATLDKTVLNFSGGLSGLYNPQSYATGSAEHEWTFVPELLRFEAAFIPKPGAAIRAGRMNVSDPSGGIINGMFDGLAGRLGIGGASVSLGAWYSGLLWKKSAYITMSRSDAAEYAEDTKFDESYLAPRRVLFMADVDSGGVFLSADSLRAGLSGQVDIRDEDRLHSQYFTLVYSLPIRSFGVSVNATGELIELPDADEDDRIGFAVSAGVNGYWQPEMTPFRDRLSVGYLWTSGGVEDGIDAFVPVSTIPVGHVLQAKPSGISAVNLGYQALILANVSASIEAAYFLRTDKATFTDTDLEYDDDAALGGEIYAQVSWSPVSDVSVSAGGGAFFPKTGNAYNDDAKIRAAATLGLLFSLW